MSERNARRMRSWAATLVAVTGAATMQANADTFYVNGSCGDDSWTGRTEAGSQNVLSLRVAWLNKDWDRLWDARPLARAA